MAALKRLESELTTIERPEYMYIDRVTDNAYQLVTSIKGPPESPYSGGTFWITIDVPINYPFRPPKVRFITKIRHIKAHPNGDFCLKILSEWEPRYTVIELLKSIYSALCNPWEPIRCCSCAIFTEEMREEYAAEACEWTLRYAMDRNPPSTR